MTTRIEISTEDARAIALLSETMRTGRNRMTSYPYWIIRNNKTLQSVAGIFMSCDDADAYIACNSHTVDPDSVHTYCASGFRSETWKALFKASERVAAIVAEVEQ